MPYLPQSDPNIKRPTPEQVLWNINRVNQVADAVARAKAASFCPGNAGWNGTRWVATGEGSGSNTGTGTQGGANYQGGGGSGLYDSPGGMGPGGLTQEQLDDIQNAPTVQSQHNEPCVEVVESTCLAPLVSNPPWGNEWAGMPAQTCATGLLDQTAAQAKALPWWVLLLIAVGGAMAVREVLD